MLKIQTQKLDFDCIIAGEFEMTKNKRQNIVLYSIFGLFIVGEILNFFFLPYITVFNNKGEYYTATLFRLLQAHGQYVWFGTHDYVYGVTWYPEMLPYLLFIFAMLISMIRGKKFFWSSVSALMILVAIFLVLGGVGSGCSGTLIDETYEGGWVEFSNFVFDPIHCVFFFAGIVFIYVNCYLRCKQKAKEQDSERIADNETATCPDSNNDPTVDKNQNTATRECNGNVATN